MRWRALAEKLAEAAMDPREATVLDHIDLLGWARAKATLTNFGELVREKWRNSVLPAGRPSIKAKAKRAA